MALSKDQGQQSREQQQLAGVLNEADGTIAAGPESLVEPSIPGDRTRMFTHTSFSRMRVTWKPDEQTQVAYVHSVCDQMLREQFPEVYWFLEHELYPMVREAQVDAVTQKPLKDAAGRPRWKHDDEGHVIERWDRLGDEERKQLLYTISTRLIGWRQQAATTWGSAMFAKGLWEVQFAQGYVTTPGSKPTIDDRTQFGRLGSVEERYFAIVMTIVSRRADALVRSMERIEEMLLKTMRS